MDNIKLIMDYEDGVLSDEEKKEFEERLKTDKSLRNDFNLSRNIDEALMEEDVIKLSKDLNNIIN